MYRFNRHIVFVLLIILLAGCSTKKNRFLNRGYHNLTARYNGYFNARESVKEGLAQLNKAHKDNYDDILEIFPEGDKADAATVNPQMNRAIKKCGRVIQKHSIYIKKEEHCKWIDDSYLLIGKADFYKQDYRTALRTFDYVAKEYKTSEIKYEALLWMVRCHAELGQFIDAQVILDMIKNDKKFPDELKGQLETIYADYYLKQNDKIDAIIHLRKAISLTKKKKDRVRLMFILAQLYQKQGDLRKAGQLYEQVVKMNPPYEMAFNAKINRARTLGVDKDNLSSRRSEEVRKQLEKMLRDDKNIEYFDQIYFTLAEMALNEGNTQEALVLLNKSIRASQENTHQKGLSYLLMADTYFDNRSYENAQAYYDSSVTFLSQEYEHFEEALNKKNSLNGLVKNIHTIEIEDSLQMIARMTDIERNIYIDDMIAAAVKKEEELRMQKEEQERRARELILEGGIAQRKGNNKKPGPGGWYFYNHTQLSQGIADFKTRWGDRKLEDNWRRSTKTSFNFDISDNDTTGGGQGRDLVVSNIRDKKEYLKNLPLNEEDLQVSHERIMDALYQLGIIYKERLKDLDESIKTFEELNKRYPKSRYRPAACYYLYLMYQEKGNNTMAEKNKNILLNKYPETEYAQLISNPNYLEERKNKLMEVEIFYEATLMAYYDHNDSTVMLNCQIADSIFKTDVLIPKFSFLRAMTLGRQATDSVFVEALTLLANRYGYHEVGTRAKEILDAMAGLNDTTRVDSVPELKKIKWDMNQKQDHFYVAILPNNNIDLDAFKKNVSDFNHKFFGTTKLSITTMLLGKNYQLVIVKNFPNSEKALDYLAVIMVNDGVYGGMDLANIEQIVITAPNFVAFYKDIAIKQYMRHFYENYKVPTVTK